MPRKPPFYVFIVPPPLNPVSNTPTAYYIKNLFSELNLHGLWRFGFKVCYRDSNVEDIEVYLDNLHALGYTIHVVVLTNLWGPTNYSSEEIHKHEKIMHAASEAVLVWGTHNVITKCGSVLVMDTYDPKEKTFLKYGRQSLPVPYKMIRLQHTYAASYELYRHYDQQMTLRDYLIYTALQIK